MGLFQKTQLTIKGRELLAKAMAGSPLKFTRGVMGSGICDGNFDHFLTVLEPKVSGPIVKIETLGNGGCDIRLRFTNQDITTAFLFSELGIYAEDPDVGEILYAYTYVPDHTMADYIPSETDVFVEEEITVGTWISNAENITTIIQTTVAATEIKYTGKYAQFGSTVEEVLDEIITCLLNYYTLSADEVPPNGTKVHSKILDQVTENLPQMAFVQNIGTGEIDPAKLTDDNQISNGYLRKENFDGE